MSERTAESPAHDRHPPTAEAAPQPPAGPPPEPAPVSEAEQRPSGALAVTAFLVVAILVSWFGMYALNIVRN